MGIGYRVSKAPNIKASEIQKISMINTLSKGDVPDLRKEREFSWHPRDWCLCGKTVLGRSSNVLKGDSTKRVKAIPRVRRSRGSGGVVLGIGTSRRGSGVGALRSCEPEGDGPSRKCRAIYEIIALSNGTWPSPTKSPVSRWSGTRRSIATFFLVSQPEKQRLQRQPCSLGKVTSAQSHPTNCFHLSLYCGVSSEILWALLEEFY